MNKFIVLFNLEGEFSQSTFPELFDFLLSMPIGIRLGEVVIALSFDGNCEDLHRKLSYYTKERGEILIFEVCDACWTVDSLRSGKERDSQMRKFLDS